MAESVDVVRMLRPEGGWVVRGNDYEGIEFISCDPFTKKEWKDGFAICDAWIAEQDATKTQAKAAAEAKLSALGLTTDDLRALGL